MRFLQLCNKTLTTKNNEKARLNIVYIHTFLMKKQSPISMGDCFFCANNDLCVFSSVGDYIDKFKIINRDFFVVLYRHALPCAVYRNLKFMPCKIGKVGFFEHIAFDKLLGIFESFDFHHSGLQLIEIFATITPEYTYIADIDIGVFIGRCQNMEDFPFCFERLESLVRYTCFEIVRCVKRCSSTPSSGYFKASSSIQVSIYQPI